MKYEKKQITVVITIHWISTSTSSNFIQVIYYGRKGLRVVEL